MNRTRRAAGRPTSTTPRRIATLIRLTADEAAAIDAARGDATRAAWCRDAAIEKATNQQRPSAARSK